MGTPSYEVKALIHKSSSDLNYTPQSGGRERPREQFLKLLNRVAIQASNFTPRYISKRSENLYPHKNLYMNVHSSLIHNSQKVEKKPNAHKLTKDKQNVAYPYNAILFVYKKE